MILNNMKSWKNWALIGGQYYNMPASVASLKTVLPMKDINGNITNTLFTAGDYGLTAINMGYVNDNANTYDAIGRQSSSVNNTSMNLWIGSSEADETETDNALSWITDVTPVSNSFTVTRTVSDGKAYLTYRREFVATADITVKEIGLLKPLIPIVQYTAITPYLFVRKVVKNTASEGETDSRFKPSGTQFAVELVVELD